MQAVLFTKLKKQSNGFDDEPDEEVEVEEELLAEGYVKGSLSITTYQKGGNFGGMKDSMSSALDGL